MLKSSSAPKTPQPSIDYQKFESKPPQPLFPQGPAPSVETEKKSSN